MIEDKKTLWIVLLIPIFCLLALTAQKKYIRSTGVEVYLPIEGYDPRDLISGHYLIYRVDYGVPNLCANYYKERYVCLDDRSFTNEQPTNCKLFIKGRCTYGDRFEAGIERYYIPESVAAELEKLVREKKTGINISVSSDGVAQVKDLVIEGQIWGK